MKNQRWWEAPCWVLIKHTWTHLKDDVQLSPSTYVEEEGSHLSQDCLLVFSFSPNMTMSLWKCYLFRKNEDDKSEVDVWLC